MDLPDFRAQGKIQELKELKKTIEFFHRKIEIFCAQVRDNPVSDEKEIAEKIELAQIHNKLVSLASLNLYTKPEFRRKVHSIVGKWITNKRIEMMQRGNRTNIPEEEIAKTWKQFNNEYKNVNKIIDAEAEKFI